MPELMLENLNVFMFSDDGVTNVVLRLGLLEAVMVGSGVVDPQGQVVDRGSTDGRFH